MSPKQILVTGAGGFVGKALIPFLLSEFPDSNIIGLHRFEIMPTTPYEPRQRSRAIDLTNGDIDALIAEIKPDVIVHLAGISSVQQSLSVGGSAFEENLTSGLRIIRAISAHVPDAALVFASTGEVYGRSFLTTPIATETTAILPNSPYARSKAALEFAIQDMLGQNGRAVALRLFNHFGQGQSENFVIASLAAQLRAIRNGATPVIHVGNLEAKRDFLPLADILPAYCAAIKYALAQALGAFEVFNIASGSPRRIAEILDDMVRLSGLLVSVENDPKRMRPSEIELAAGDASKFSKATGWHPAAIWDEALTALL